MRWYFLWGLVATSIIILVLFILMMISLRRNWNHTNRSVFSFFIPLLLVVLLVYLAASQFAPRVFDAVQIVYGQYASTEINLSEENFEYNRIVTGEEVFYYPPSHFENPEAGRYQIYFTERTNYVMNLIFVGETEDISGAPLD
ncbi:MAG: hypothetical protein PHR78_00170 [Eubacteriales bacterium]|nr:hypothetical protein [Eubacteriales bacterium]MDD4323317.1 hypothetical protein [Eubacteriales bacterium]MDD4540572.1 hypothetical protein [Eubacteriales bacterium]